VGEAREGCSAPAAALIAAERASTGELRRRRAGEDGAGAWARGAAPPESPLGRRGGESSEERDRSATRTSVVLDSFRHLRDIISVSVPSV